MFHLGSKSLWVDECGSLEFAQQPWREFWKTMWHGEANMLTYYLMLRGWIHLGTSESLLRSLSVIPAVATIWVVYLLGKRLFSVQVGLVSAFLLAVNACHVAYSQEARSYALLIFLCSLSLLTFVIAVEQSTTAHWFFYASVTVLGLYTHFFTALLILAEWVSLLLLPRSLVDRRRFGWSALLIGVVCLPVAWFILTKDVGQLDFIPNPGFMELYRLLLFLTSYGGKVFGALVAVVYFAGLCVAIYLFWSRWKNFERSTGLWHIGLLCISLLLPVFLDVAISHLGKQMFYYRYLLLCLPALTVLAARGLCSLPSRYWLSAGVLVTGCLCLATVRRYYATPKQDWREATRYLLRNTRSDDTVLFYPFYAGQPLKYYEQQLGPRGNALKVIPAQLFPLATSRNARPRVIWLLSNRQDSFLREYQHDLSRVYFHRYQLHYDGSVLLEEYSDEEPTSRNRSYMKSGSVLASGLAP